MNEEQAPITLESEICKVMPCVLDKGLVDLVNGINISEDHIREQDRRKGFRHRLIDGFSGQGARRQANINASVNDALKGLLHCLTDLTHELASTNKIVAQHGLALAKINVAVGKLYDDMAALASSAATRTELEDLANKIKRRLGEAEDRLTRVEAKQEAMIHLDIVFNDWKLGKYQGLSVLGQCYAALEELKWGAFGYYCHTQSAYSESLLNSLKGKAKVQLSVASGRSAGAAGERIRTTDWLKQPDNPLSDGVDALAYLGEDYVPELAPFVSVVTHPNERWPLEVPCIVNANRAAPALIWEIFEEGQHG